MAPSDVKIRCQQTLTTSQVNYLPKEVLQVVGVIETMIREISLRIINFCVFFSFLVETIWILERKR